MLAGLHSFLEVPGESLSLNFPASSSPFLPSLKAAITGQVLLTTASLVLCRQERVAVCEDSCDWIGSICVIQADVPISRPLISFLLLYGRAFQASKQTNKWRTILWGITTVTYVLSALEQGIILINYKEWEKICHDVQYSWCMSIIM